MFVWVKEAFLNAEFRKYYTEDTTFLPPKSQNCLREILYFLEPPGTFPSGPNGHGSSKEKRRKASSMCTKLKAGSPKFKPYSYKKKKKMQSTTKFKYIRR
jgi:hypothetical protein